VNSSNTLSALDKFGAAGTILAAAAAPCCFPLFAAIGAALGMTALQSWRGYMDYAIQGFALISVIGNVFAFRQHRKIGPLVVALASAALIFFAFYVNYYVAFIYAGMGGLAVAVVWNIIAIRQGGSRCKRLELQSTITCPHCGHQKTETMPTDACLYFYECPNCHVMLRPKPGDCCVFCSYGSIKCPPMQTGNSCCAS
jgi:hypothetical protein